MFLPRTLLLRAEVFLENQYLLYVLSQAYNFRIGAFLWVSDVFRDDDQSSVTNATGLAVITRLAIKSEQ